MKDQKGFTLIELMIVVAIVGILLAIALPKFGQMRAESYKREHGHYPEGYTPLQQRERPVRELETVKKSVGTIDYFYDSKTELCFAHYQEGCITAVPCDKIMHLFNQASAPKGGF